MSGRFPSFRLPNVRPVSNVFMPMHISLCETAFTRENWWADRRRKRPHDGIGAATPGWQQEYEKRAAGCNPMG